jgi:hypothetical protein
MLFICLYIVFSSIFVIIVGTLKVAVWKMVKEKNS